MSEFLINDRPSRKREAVQPEVKKLTRKEEQFKAGLWLIACGGAGLAAWALLFIGLVLLNWIEIEIAWTLIFGMGVFIAAPLALAGFCLLITARNSKNITPPERE